MPKRNRKGNVNLTGRRRLNRKLFKLKVDWEKMEISTLDLNLGSLMAGKDGIPANSPVSLTARFRDVWEEFDLGVVGALDIPSEMSLKKFGSNPITFQFRLRSAKVGEEGILNVRSAKFSHSKPQGGTIKLKVDEYHLLHFEIVTFSTKGVPLEIQFPTNPQGTVSIRVNQQECPQLFEALDEGIGAYWGLVVVPYLSTIVERLASDANRGAFEPTETPDENSEWQCMMNAVFKDWVGHGVQDIDIEDGEEVSEWARKVSSHFCRLIGNPALAANTLVVSS